MYAIARYPHLLGIGVDEDTAAIIEGDILTVIGRGAVTVIDGSAMTGCDLSSLAGRDPVAFSGIRLHIFTQGEKYHLRERQKIQTAGGTDTPG